MFAENIQTPVSYIRIAQAQNSLCDPWTQQNIISPHVRAFRNHDEQS